MKRILVALGLLAAPLAAAPMVQPQPAAAALTVSKLGDLSDMRKIISDTLDLVEAGKNKEAAARITEYETAWDHNEKRLRALDTETWRKLDEASDVALSTVRYPSTTPDEMKADLKALIALLDNPAL